MSLLLRSLSEEDCVIMLHSKGIWEVLSRSFTEGIVSSSGGRGVMIDSEVYLRKPVLEVEKITHPIQYWHGGGDKTSPSPSSKNSPGKCQTPPSTSKINSATSPSPSPCTEPPKHSTRSPQHPENMPDQPLRDEQEHENWVDIGSYSTLDDAYDHALVALAMGESIRVEHGNTPGEFDLQAEPEAAPKISAELREYAAESESRILPKVISSNWAKHPTGWLYVFVWAATLILVFDLQTQDPSLSGSFASSSIGLIERGEWWRPFTALFLHGDGPHIVGNLGTGAVFGILVSKSIGPLKGWALILIAGTVGNATTSLLTHPEPFTSLGASTAVFGALGILSGIGLVENCREDVRMPWVRVLGPLLAGMILLGWLGGAAPGAGVDVFGHVFGFCAGIIAGAACRYLEREPSESLHEPPKQPT